MLRGKNYDPIKRVLDFSFSLVLFLILLPIQVLIAIVIAITLGRPILFRQERPGRDARTFTLLKFRSMRNLDQSKGHISDSERLPKIGKILRSTSLDELPSLINVLKGDMSLIGPRPLLTEYLALYSPEQARRHEVRPGVTGLAQIKGRNSISWEDKFIFDVDYVDNRSFMLDAQIAFSTLFVVLQQKGISSSGHVTTTKFEGGK